MAGLAHTISRVAIRAARRVARALPESVRRRVDDRVFYAVFNLTRVTNDAYGWRPSDPDAPADAPPSEPPHDPLR